jgi:SAM-dependent methyltransferase
MQHAETGDVDELVAELRRRVEERYRSGEYPPDLEPDLSQHFEAVATASRPHSARFASLLRAVEEASDFQPGRISTGSSLPMGSHVHRLIASVTRRQTVGVLRQVQAYAAAMHELVVELIESLPAEEPARGEAGPLGPGGRALWEALAGTREQALGRRRPLLGHLDGPVLDVGCGRGETLELLRGRGVECAGFEEDPELAAECARRGLPVERGDGVRGLEARPEGSLGGLVATQFVERSSPERVRALMALAGRRLRPGGRLVIEAGNPGSLWTLVRLLQLGGRPVAADYLELLARQAGFDRVELLPGEDGAEDRLEPLPADGQAAGALDAYNRNVERLNRSLFGPRTYVLVATR